MKEHPLGGIHRRWEEQAGIEEAAFEEKTVKYLLSHYGLAKSKWELLETQKKLTGGYNLTLHQFQEHFGSFPVYLVSAKIKDIAKDFTLLKVFKTFMARKIIKHYKDLRETVPEEYRGRPYGMVFYFPYMSRGLILHNGDEQHDGVKIIWSDGPRRLCVEPFDQFLDALPEWHLE
jgi:hypothetical protein